MTAGARFVMWVPSFVIPPNAPIASAGRFVTVPRSQRGCDARLDLRVLHSNFKPLSPMAQAIMDPEEVRRFAKELKRFNDDVQVRAASLQSRFTALGSTWQDQENEKFGEEFVSTMKMLRKFMEISEKHTPFLLRKAQRIEEYLNQR
jgi:uncharacterized protein YukE